MALQVTQAMIFQMAKVTISPPSVNKINFDHLLYESEDTHEILKNIKLKTFKTEKWITFLFFVSQFSEWVYSVNKNKCPKFRFHTDALKSSRGPPIGWSP